MLELVDSDGYGTCGVQVYTIGEDRGRCRRLVMMHHVQCRRLPRLVLADASAGSARGSLEQHPHHDGCGGAQAEPCEDVLYVLLVS